MRASTAIASDSELLSKAVRLLLELDDKICSIVLIGSFAWFPDLARDIDIVVITESNLPTDAYWDAVADFPDRKSVV